MRILFRHCPIIAVLAALTLAGCASETVVTQPEPIRFTPESVEDDGAMDIAGFRRAPGSIAPGRASLEPRSPEDVKISFATLGVHHSAVVGVDAEGAAAEDGGLAPYAADTVRIGPRWQMAAGARWDRPAPEPTGGAGLLGMDTEPRLRTALVYGSPGFGSYYAAYGDTLDPAPAQLRVAAKGDPAQLSIKPAEGDIYEAGGKWQLVGKRLTVRGAGFHTQATGAAGADADPLADYHHRVSGLELNVVASLTPRWRLHGGYGLLDSEVIASPDPAALGKKLADTAPQSAKLWTSYALELPARIFVAGGARYVDKRMADDANTASVPDYVAFDAAVTYAVNERIGLQLDLSNLTDARWYESAWDIAHAEEARSGKLTGRVQF